MIIPPKNPVGQHQLCRINGNALPFSPIQFSLSTGSEIFDFVKPANPNDVLDALLEEQYEKDKFLPYWAQLWPCSMVLFTYLAHNSLSIIKSDDIVCELGCGLGTLSTLLYTKGIRCIASDIAPDACIYTHCNIRHYADVPKVLSFDWRMLPFKKKFDVIVAADILYEQRWIKTVLDLFDESLQCGGSAYIADPKRQWLSEFKDSALQRGYALDVVFEDMVNDEKTVVELIKVTKNK